jgi:hypothetical protein
MYEFDSVSVSSYEAASLAAKLTEKSGDGWDVVSIVPAGSEITAYLRRESSGAPAAAASDAAAYATSSTSSWESTASGATETAPVSAVSEPSGWGTAPESTPTATTPAQAAATAPATPPTTPAVPAGWYTDPAGRFELRYWDGTAWTEHVSRAGQQYTDAPVA